jgi:hypothetical protein
MIIYLNVLDPKRLEIKKINIYIYLNICIYYKGISLIGRATVLHTVG